MARTTPVVMPRADTLVALGRQVFFDATMSASRKQSCASCHDPAYGWASPNALSVQIGGSDGTASGVRAVPGLTYAQDTPPFTEHFREDDGDDSEDQGAAGGFMWDGRAESLREQAGLPLLSPLEMANASRAAAVDRLRASAAAGAFRTAFGARIFDDTLSAWQALVATLDAFQQSPEEFYPYSSKYDGFLRGTVALSPQELRGLALFNDPAKGNCASCHPSARQRDGFPQFTDRGFIAIGVPRNRRIPINGDSTYYDLGLCGPLRTDLADRPEYCGAFKTPTLRNVARRKVFFHNGVFTTLEEVLRFYARRDTEPRLFYPVDRRGAVRMYDDLPRQYWGNLNVDPPFDRKRGQAPAFTDAEARDMIAFLRTLNDGYQPPRSDGGPPGS